VFGASLAGGDRQPGSPVAPKSPTDHEERHSKGEDQMNMRKAVVASFGAALLTVGTGAGAHALLDLNNTGQVSNNQTATGGDSTASNNSDATVNASVNATNSVISHSGAKGSIKQTANNNVKSGPANATNHATNKTGHQSFLIK
jgi:hypothetical protein